MTSNNVEAISCCSVSFRGQFSKFKKLFFKISKHPLPEGKQIERNVRSDNASEFPKPDYAKKKLMLMLKRMPLQLKANCISLNNSKKKYFVQIRILYRNHILLEPNTICCENFIQSVSSYSLNLFTTRRTFILFIII